MLTFGKYKGQEIKEVPDSYLKWLSTADSELNYKARSYAQIYAEKASELEKESLQAWSKDLKEINGPELWEKVCVEHDAGDKSMLPGWFAALLYCNLKHRDIIEQSRLELKYRRH